VSWLKKVAFGKSRIHGMGIFALEPIRRGTKVWTVDPSMKFVSPSELTTLSHDELRFALRGGYFHGPSHKFVYYNDGMEYMNHAPGDLANIGAREWPPLAEDYCLALRDIDPGEELFEDYTFWSGMALRNDHWLTELYRRFLPDHYDFLLEIDDRGLRKTA
jgi:SET domain-containing protein